MQTTFDSPDKFVARNMVLLTSMSPMALQVIDQFKVNNIDICECSFSMTGSCLTYQNRRDSGQTSRKCIRKVPIEGIGSVIGTLELLLGRYARIRTRVGATNSPPQSGADRAVLVV